MSFAPVPSITLGESDAPSGGSSAVSGLDGERILVPLTASEAPVVVDQVRVAAALARPTDASLRVVDPFASGRKPAATYRHDPGDGEEALLDWTLDRTTAAGSRSVGGMLSTRRLVAGVLDAVETTDVETLVVAGDATARVLGRDPAEYLATRADCEVVRVNGRSGYEPVPSILLAVAGGPHSGTAADVARRMAIDCDAWVDVLHVVPGDADPDRRETAETWVEAAHDRVARPDSTATWILEADDAAEAIAEQSAYYDLTVIGAPTTGRLRRFVSGSTSRSIRDAASSVVLSVRSGG